MLTDYITIQFSYFLNESIAMTPAKKNYLVYTV